MKPTLLVIDDEKTFRIVAEEALSAEGFTVTSAASGGAGLAAWQRDPCDLVILDRHLPDMDGVVVLEAIVRESRERGVDTLVLIATAYADVSSAVQALKIGAYDYLSKPLQLPELVVTVRKALEAKRMRAQLRQLAGRARAAMGDFVAGESAAMRQVIEMVDKVAEATDTTVLIQGESGTGKELIADLIHRRTPGRSNEPFVEINCASVPENLLESELFGYERGAFTDAKAQKRGLFEEADGGTLLLDEVGELGQGTQAKLLKVLEEMTFRRLGGTRDLTVNLRLIAATNKDLADEVERGTFRLDLYHRLDVFHIRVPSLRDRREDILPLAQHFLRIFSARMRKPAAQLAPETERILAAYDYPGNVRELRNLIERAVILSNSTVIDPTCIVISGPTRPNAPGGGVSGTSASAGGNANFSGVSGTSPGFFAADLDAGGQPPSLAELERRYIARLLVFTGGNRTQVARLLGVSYPTVAKKITDYGL
jgi:two-component system response regulator AtoC